MNATMQHAAPGSIVVLMETMTLGQFIKRRMAVRGLKPRDMATALDRSESYVSMLSNDKIGTPPPDVVHGLAKALGVKERDIIVLMGYLRDESHDSASAPVPALAPDDPRRDILKLLEGRTVGEVLRISDIVRVILGENDAVSTQGERRVDHKQDDVLQRRSS